MMEYLTIGLLVVAAVALLVRQIRRSWRGDDPCACCSARKHDSGSCGCDRKPEDRQPPEKQE